MPSQASVSGVKIWLFSAVVVVILSGCSDASPGSCVNSKPMADGAAKNVEVLVVTKPGLDAHIVAMLDVDGGLYTTPLKDLGPETDVPVGTYEGVVTKSNGHLTLEYEGQSVRLVGPESCP